MKQRGAFKNGLFLVDMASSLKMPGFTGNRGYIEARVNPSSTPSERLSKDCPEPRSVEPSDGFVSREMVYSKFIV